jgi:Heterokaryon incompatibility protein (HET)
MYLLDTKTLELVSVNDKVPPYAILSHTWGEEEVSFQDWKAGGNEGKVGYHKVRRSCEIAAQDGCSRIWVDTCCIDKSSSAELSEAINSMYRYYRNAKVCYAYLADLTFESLARDDGCFEACKWFSRGWTLQELIAPRNVVFFSTDWRPIGTKQTWASEISQVTKIDKEVLLNATDLWQVSVAKRMSWASNRTTTREEDIAYCLLGIFNISMPLIYGEGNKSFLRLQEEIMKDSTDQSMFAWNPTGTSQYGRRGILSRHPSEFADASHIVPYQASIEPFAMTNKGLRVKLPVTTTRGGAHVVVLACHIFGNFSEHIGIVMKPAEREEAGIYFRSTEPITFVSDSERRKAKVRSIYILKEARGKIPSELKHAWVRSIPQARYGFNLAELPRPLFSPNDIWNVTNRTISLSSDSSLDTKKKFGGVILTHRAHPKELIITFGCVDSGTPTSIFVDISTLPADLEDPTKLMEDIWKQGVEPQRRGTRKPLTSLIRRLPERIWMWFQIMWNAIRPIRVSRTALVNITPNKTVLAVVTIQRLMDQEVLVLDIDARDSLLQEISRTLGPKYKMFCCLLDYISLKSVWLSYAICYFLIYAISLCLVTSFLALLGLFSFPCMSASSLQESRGSDCTLPYVISFLPLITSFLIVRIFLLYIIIQIGYSYRRLWVCLSVSQMFNYYVLDYYIVNYLY